MTARSLPSRLIVAALAVAALSTAASAAEKVLGDLRPARPGLRAAVMTFEIMYPSSN